MSRWSLSIAKACTAVPPRNCGRSCAATKPMRAASAWPGNCWCLWFGKHGVPRPANVSQGARRYWNRVLAVSSNWRSSKRVAASPVWCWVSAPCWPKLRQTWLSKQCNTVAPKPYSSGAAKTSARHCSLNASWHSSLAQQNLDESNATTFISPPRPSPVQGEGAAGATSPQGVNVNPVLPPPLVGEGWGGGSRPGLFERLDAMSFKVRRKRDGDDIAFFELFQPVRDGIGLVRR